LGTDLMRRGYRGIRVVARGVDTALFNPARRSPTLRKAWNVGDDDLVVAHVGRLAPEKNLPLLLATFAAIRGYAPSARLLLVGDGPSRRQLEKRHPEHIFAGMRHGEDLAAHYASADLFLFPSMTETYGNVTLEALASGLPVVAYRMAAAAELIRHDDNGMLADPGASDQFVRAALDLVTREPPKPRHGAWRRSTGNAFTTAWWMRCARPLADPRFPRRTNRPTASFPTRHRPCTFARSSFPTSISAPAAARPNVCSTSCATTKATTCS
jgi:glycosyltransferase involved in cell wall biosynthesis